MASNLGTQSGHEGVLSSSVLFTSSPVEVFPGGTSGKEPACEAGDRRDTVPVPGLGRFPWRGAWQPTPVFLPGKPHGHGVTKSQSRPQGQHAYSEGETQRDT